MAKVSILSHEKKNFPCKLSFPQWQLFRIKRLTKASSKRIPSTFQARALFRVPSKGQMVARRWALIVKHAFAHTLTICWINIYLALTAYQTLSQAIQEWAMAASRQLNYHVNVESATKKRNRMPTVNIWSSKTKNRHKNEIETRNIQDKNFYFLFF